MEDEKRTDDEGSGVKRDDFKVEFYLQMVRGKREGRKPKSKPTRNYRDGKKHWAMATKTANIARRASLLT